jgi:hypothetical protein
MLNRVRLALLQWRRDRGRRLPWAGQVALKILDRLALLVA